MAVERDGNIGGFLVTSNGRTLDQHSEVLRGRTRGVVKVASSRWFGGIAKVPEGSDPDSSTFYPFSGTIEVGKYAGTPPVAVTMGKLPPGHFPTICPEVVKGGRGGTSLTLGGVGWMPLYSIIR